MSQLLGVFSVLEMKFRQWSLRGFLCCGAGRIHFHWCSEGNEDIIMGGCRLSKLSRSKAGTGLRSTRCFVWLISIKPKEHGLFWRHYEKQGIGRLSLINYQEADQSVFCFPQGDCEISDRLWVFSHCFSSKVQIVISVGDQAVFSEQPTCVPPNRTTVIFKSQENPARNLL